VLVRGYPSKTSDQKQTFWTTPPPLVQHRPFWWYLLPHVCIVTPKRSETQNVLRFKDLKRKSLGEVGYIPDVQKCFFVGISEFVSESNTPPQTDCNIFCVSDVFMRDTVRTSLDGGGGDFKTDDVEQRGGGCPKSQFLLGRLWWPLISLSLM